jgi:L-ascorbate metabolism protein UlaG (beta-lactamase superfamily)
VSQPALTVTRVAHSTVLIDLDRQRPLTDPWSSERWSYHHGEPHGIRLEHLPRLDGVLVSRDHYDHFDLDSFRRYPDKQVPLVLKRGLAAKARAAGFGDVRELDAWETARLGPVAVTAAPGKHKVPEITFVLEGSGHTVYLGADSLFMPELRELARRFPRPDLALVPVNGLALRPLLNRHGRRVRPRGGQPRPGDERARPGAGRAAGGRRPAPARANGRGCRDGRGRPRRWECSGLSRACSSALAPADVCCR